MEKLKFASLFLITLLISGFALVDREDNPLPPRDSIEQIDDTNPQALIGLKPLIATADFFKEDEFCWKETYGRGVGTVPNICPNGMENQAGLCYTLCKEGYYGVGPVCWKKCPEGYRDDGAYCFKPESYTRGAGYPWKVGDKPFNTSGQMKRCEEKHGKGNCEVYGAIVYPKCKEGFYAAGCCVCSPECPEGFTDIGISCQKPSYGRGVGIAPKICPDGQENNAGLCYQLCKTGFQGVGPVCWEVICPTVDGTSWVDCGAGCAKSSNTCATAIIDMVVSPLTAVLSIAGMVVTGGGSGAATSAITATTTTGKVLKYTKKAVTAAAKISKAVIKADLIAKAKEQLNGQPIPEHQMKGIDEYASMAYDAARTYDFDWRDFAAVDPTGLASVAAAYANPLCKNIKSNAPVSKVVGRSATRTNTNTTTPIATTSTTTTSTVDKSKDGLFDLNGTYYITDAKHDESLRAAPGGGIVHHDIPHNSPASTFNWYFMPTGDGYYYIYNLQFNKALVSADYGGGISQKDPNGKATAQWKITPSGIAGKYIITDRKNGKSLVAGDENSNFIDHQPHNNRQNAYWTFTVTDAKAPANKPNPNAITETPAASTIIKFTPIPEWFKNNKSWLGNDYVRIQNKAKNIHYIYNQDSQPKHGPIEAGSLSSHWKFIPYAGREDRGNFRNRSNPNLYLIFNRTGKLEIIENANHQWSTALWDLKPSPEQGWVYIKSAKTGGDLFIKNGQLIVGGIEGDPGNGLWKIEGVTTTTEPVTETPASNTSSADFVQIQNYWKKSHFIHNQNGKLEAGSIQTDWLGSQWKIVPVHSGWVRIQNQLNSDHYLHNQNGKIEAGTIDPNWASAMWKLIPANTGWVRIQNSWNKDLYLHNQNGKIEVGKIDPNWGSALWKVANEKNRTQESITSVTASEALPPASSGFVRIQNNWKKSQYIHNQNGTLKAGLILSNWSSSEWEIVKYTHGDWVLLQSKLNPDHYLNIQGGKLKVGTIDLNYPGALWKLVPAQTGWVRIESTTSDQYLHNQNGKIEIGKIDPNWASALWKVE